MHLSLQSVVEQATGLSFSEITLKLRAPLEFQNNNLYDIWADGRHLIAKEWTKPSELEDAPKREFVALQQLAHLDIAPRPIFYDPTTAPIVVYEFMEGEMWDRQKPSPQQLAQLAEVWLMVHTVVGADVGLSMGQKEFSVRRLFDRYRRQFQRYAAWADRCFAPGLDVVPLIEELLRKGERAAKQLDKLTPLLCFSRADPRFANVIQRPDGRLGLIDWEDSGLRDPAHDAADLLTHPNNEDLLTRDEWQAFLQPYLAEREVHDPSTSERMHLYTAIFPIFWLAALLSLGVSRAEAGKLGSGCHAEQRKTTQRKTAWRVNGMEPNERLRRYLARGLAWPEDTFLNELQKPEVPWFFFP